MHPHHLLRLTIFTIAIALLPVSPLRADGLFEKDQDIGTVKHAGTVAYDETAHRYTVSGGGQNMWLATDAFHFVWKKVSGDVSLSAVISFPKAGGDAHRKAVLMVRQSLDPDSPYADAALHGDGLTSLQYREEKGARTYEIQADATGPQRLRIEKRGRYVSMSIAAAGEELRHAGGSFRLELKEPFYVGIGVCSHNDEVLEIAEFSNVQLVSDPPVTVSADAKPKVVCTLETVPITSKDRRAVMVTNDLIEAPNWTPDGASLIYNSKGRLHRIAAAGGASQVIDTGFADRCNNDHGISPDGKMLVISDQSQQQKRSMIYTLPIGGGTPQRITALAPSYWHGWSPDGKTLAYCAERNGAFDIYTIPAAGGEEKRLTDAKGLDDGPDYSPDGQWIYFNSDRTGQMQIWRMKTDGSMQEQVTKDDFNNWFPHPSPDGQWLVFLSYDKAIQGHPENQDVSLRLLPLSGEKREPEVLAKLFGGQGTLNVPSWSPDSKKVAFVSYQLAH